MTEPDDPTANIRAELARRSLSRAELARRIGENEMWVSRRMSGQVPITVPDLLRIAAAIGVPATDLLPDKASA